MRTILAFAATGALFASVLAIPASASASAQGCRNTGTVVGGVAGALLGNGVASGGGKTGGTIIGGLGGAVVGHEIAKRNCGSEPPPQRCRYHTYHRKNGTAYRVHECMAPDGYWRRS